MTKIVTTGILFTACAFGQSQAEQTDKLKAEMQVRLNTTTDGMTQAFFISTEGIPETKVVDTPYSAEETNTTTQTLFDGNRIVHSSTTKVFRDSQGRTRIERVLSNIGPLAAGQPSVSITVNDPVANVRYTLDAESRTAYKTATQNSEGSSQAASMLKLKQMAEEMNTAKVRTEGNPSVVSYSTVRRAERNAKREDLGTSNMAGVPVKGTRSTMTIPAGAEGNDRDMNIVDERWYSPDLKMNIMTKHSDPRMGETVFQVTNLSRSNPDPSLFQVPADYQIKDGPPRALRFNTTRE
jgi:hypothetical protein